MNFVVLWLFAKVFSVNFSPIRKSFLPQKFPAIQYDIYTHIYLTYFNYYSLHSGCQMQSSVEAFALLPSQMQEFGG